MKKELDVAIKAARQSGNILMEFYEKKIKINKKPDKSPVTIADKESERVIINIIKKHYPNHNFLCEEFKYKQTSSPFKWIIDPLDGTRNFIRGMPFFGNSIALEKNGKIVTGAINMPAMNLFAYASRGKGAFVNETKIKVSYRKKIKEAFLSFGSLNKYLDNYKNQFCNLIKTCDSHRGFGDTLMFLLLAQGKVDIALDCVHPWDVAAAKIIIEEAGGKMTDFKGKDTIYSETILATNGKMHSNILKILNRK